MKVAPFSVAAWSTCKGVRPARWRQVEFLVQREAGYLQASAEVGAGHEGNAILLESCNQVELGLEQSLERAALLGRDLPLELLHRR